MEVLLLGSFPQLCVVLRIFNRLNPRYHCLFLYDDAEEAVMEGLGQVQRQRGRQDACATEEKAKLRGKWHRHSCLPREPKGLCAVHEAWDSEPRKPRGIASPLLTYGTAIKTPRKPFHYSKLKNSNRR
jgi:hypothetical protein